MDAGAFAFWVSVMTVILDYPTFSDSPFFFDRRNISIPQQEAAFVQVCRHLLYISGWRAESLMLPGSLGTTSRVLSSEGRGELPLWRELA